MSKSTFPESSEEIKNSNIILNESYTVQGYVPGFRFHQTAGTIEGIFYRSNTIEQHWSHGVHEKAGLYLTLDFVFIFGYSANTTHLFLHSDVEHADKLGLENFPSLS